MNFPLKILYPKTLKLQIQRIENGKLKLKPRNLRQELYITIEHSNLKQTFQKIQEM